MELDERFIASLRSLDIGTGSNCVVALSGGGDSVALLNLIIRTKAKYHLNCSAARVIHGIRDLKSENAENSFCEKLCAEHSIPFRVLFAEKGTVSDIKRRFGCSTEQAARTMRQRLLREHMEVSRAQYIFYGHTADDNLETIFMRLLSGSGAEGLGGIEALRGEAVRPLLRFKREELRDYLVSNDIDWIEDESNNSKAYRRNRIRNELLPLITEIFPGWPKALSLLGEKSREAARALRKLCSTELGSTAESAIYMWKEGDWDSASEYSKILALWDAFNYLDDSEIPDRRIPWRGLKEARAAIDARRTWNSYGFKLTRKHGFVEMELDKSPDALGPSGGRIILSRDEVKRGFAANIGSYDIAVSLKRPTYPGISALRIENWPLEIRFDNCGIKVGHKTKIPFLKEITDSGEEMVYISIKKNKVGINAG